MKIRIFPLIGLLSLICCPPSFARTIGSYQEFTASVSDYFTCAEVVNVEIYASEQNAFEKNTKGLAKMAGLVRTAIGFDCPKIQKIQINGYYNGQKTITSSLSKNKDWTLAPLEAAVTTSDNMSASKKSSTVSAPVDLANIPPYKGYQITLVRDPVCFNKLSYNIQDVKNREIHMENIHVDEAITHFGIMIEDICPETNTIYYNYKLKNGKNGPTISSFKSNYWHSSYRIARTINDKIKSDHQTQFAQLKIRPEPSHSTPNPLADRGYYASTFLGKDGTLSLYAAYQDQKDYRKEAILVALHDINPNTPILHVTYNDEKRQLVASREFMKQVNSILTQARYFTLKVDKIRHYLTHFRDADKIPFGTFPLHIEPPLIISKYTRDYRGQYIIPNLAQAGNVQMTFNADPVSFSDSDPLNNNATTLTNIQTVRMGLRTRFAEQHPEIDMTLDADDFSPILFEELGLTLIQKNDPNNSSVLLVVKSTNIDPIYVENSQLLKINDLYVKSFEQLEEGLAVFKSGQQAILQFSSNIYRMKQNKHVITLGQKTVERLLPKNIQIVKNRYPSLEYNKKHKQLREHALQNGYVYKNENYWAAFNDDGLRRITSGTDDGFKVDSPLVRLLIDTYVRLLENKCPALIGDDPGIFNHYKTTTTFNGYGNVMSKNTTKEGRIIVKRRFVPIYAYYYKVNDDGITIPEVLKKTYETAVTANTPGGLNMMYKELASRMKFIKDTRTDVNILLEKENCSGPLIAQFEENIYRLATNQDIIQKSNVSFSLPGAKEATDEVYLPGKATSIFTACYAERDFAGYREDEYCKCQDKYFNARLPKDIIELAKSDYSEFLRKLEGGLLTGNGRNYHDMRRSCSLK